MPTLYQNPNLGDAEDPAPPNRAGYSMPRAMDTRVPPKPKAMLGAVAVDGVEIPEAEILREAQHHPSENPGQALQAAAQALVVRQLLLNEAERIGIDTLSDDEGDGAAHETWEEAVIGKLLEREVPVPRANEMECRRFYENNPDRFRSVPLYEARHILLSASEADIPRRHAALGQALALCEELNANPSRFEEFARAFSDCPSAEQGGNLGQIQPGSTVPEFETALGKMESGTVSTSPVETRYGFHVITLDRKVEPEQLPFSSVCEEIAAWLEAQTWTRAMAEYVSILAEAAQISGIGLVGWEGEAHSTTPIADQVEPS